MRILEAKAYLPVAEFNDYKQAQIWEIHRVQTQVNKVENTQKTDHSVIFDKLKKQKTQTVKIEQDLKTKSTEIEMMSRKLQKEVAQLQK